ncbi:magnesium transporter [Candidatus Poribacteria bacterium]|nr:magnesium transporter [Candidatus Poribacteria bacterium]
MEERRQQVVDKLINALNEVQVLKTALENISPDEIARAISILKQTMDNAHPVEIAQALRHLDPEEQEDVIDPLTPEDSSEVILALRDVDENASIQLVEELTKDELSEMLNNMEPDDAADIIADLPEGDAAEILRLMEKEDAESVQELLKYPEDTAGGIMTSEYSAIGEDLTTVEALKYLKDNPPHRQIFYIYVVDNKNRLLGTVPLDRIITEKENRKLGDIALPSVVTVLPDTDREEAALLVTQYNMLALPVVDEQDHLLGVITIDDAMDTLQDEATEDIYKLAGSSDDELLSRSAFKVAQIRLPWLFICLAGSLFSGFVIRMFSGTLAQAIAIASFIPAIMAMGGNTGLQSSTATVRGIATGYIPLTQISKVIFKEMRTALIMGLVCGLLMAGVAYLWKGGQIALGVVVGTSIFLAVSLSANMGVMIPIIFKKLNVDPAVASGPLITMINDITGLLVYLTMSTILIKHIA